MSEPTIKGRTVLKYLKRFKPTPSRQLARIIYNDNKLLFDSLKQVYGYVRYYRGAKGKINREHLEDRHYTPQEPPQLPQSRADDYTPFEIEGVERLGVMGDIHIPYQSNEAIKLAVAHMKQRSVDGVLILGDLIDFHQLSHFRKDPRKRSPKLEIEDTKKFLYWLRYNLGERVQIVYKLGNHDERYDKYVMNKAPEIFDIVHTTLYTVLELDKMGIEVVNNKRIVTCNELPFLHGHEWQRGLASPVNPARGAFLKSHSTVVVAHLHRTSEHSERSLDGSTIATWSLGCLCDLHPEYAPINSWNHGFAVVDNTGTGEFEVNNRKIVKGKVR